MTLSEFKAWFEGFTEDMEGPPNAKQWKRIQQRIKAVDDIRLTERVIREYWPRREPYIAYLSAGSCSTERLSSRSAMSLCAEPSAGGVGRVAFAQYRNAAPEQIEGKAVDVVETLRALGKADAAVLKAA